MAEQQYPKEMLIELYRTMVRIRKFEQKAASYFKAGMMAGTIHSSVGEEAVAAGACYAMGKGDYMATTHRGHGHTIAKGANIDRMMAELFGKKTGYCKGKGGSMHIADVEGIHHLGANGIVGGGIAIAGGSALASWIMGDKHVSVCFFGDGATNQGILYETLNMASTWKLPIVFIIENNSYAVSTEIHRVTPTEYLAGRATGFAVPNKTVDGNDPVVVYEAAKEAYEHARSGKGPYLLEFLTYRHEGHYVGDPCKFIPDSYMKAAHEHDCIINMRARLIEDGTATEEELATIEKAADEEIQHGYEYAVASPYPDPGEALEDEYTTDNERSVAR